MRGSVAYGERYGVGGQWGVVWVWFQLFQVAVVCGRKWFDFKFRVWFCFLFCVLIFLCVSWVA